MNEYCSQKPCGYNTTKEQCVMVYTGRRFASQYMCSYIFYLINEQSLLQRTWKIHALVICAFS